MIRIAISAVFVALAIIALSGAALADEVVVKVGHNRLEPAEVSIAVGGVVRFHNEDEMPGGHTVVADDGSFHSPDLGKGEDWSHQFEKSGTYSYSIKQHPSAKGRIVVK